MHTNNKHCRARATERLRKWGGTKNLYKYRGRGTRGRRKSGRLHDTLDHALCTANRGVTIVPAIASCA